MQSKNHKVEDASVKLQEKFTIIFLASQVFYVQLLRIDSK